MSTSTESEKTYRIALDGAEVGEMSIRALEEMLAEGRLPADAFYLHPTRREWESVRKLIEDERAREALAETHRLQLDELKKYRAENPKLFPHPAVPLSAEYAPPALVACFNFLAAISGVGMVIGAMAAVGEKVPDSMIVLIIVGGIVQAMMFAAFAQILDRLAVIAADAERVVKLLSEKK